MPAISVIAIDPEDANGTDHPDQDEWCRERKADGGFVGSITNLSCVTICMYIS